MSITQKHFVEIIINKGPFKWKQRQDVSMVVAPFLKECTLPLLKADINVISTGAYIGEELNKPFFQIKKISWDIISNVTQMVCVLKAVKDIFLPQKSKFILWKEGISLATITISDRGYEGIRKDESGPLIEEILKQHLPISIVLRSIIPDDYYTIMALIMHFAIDQKIDLIVTTGGTGVTERDITPDVTQRLIEKRLWGFEHAIYQEGLKKTKNAIISRAVCGILLNSLIINLPGSKRAVEENLLAILPTLNHTLKKIQNDPSECGE